MLPEVSSALGTNAEQSGPRLPRSASEKWASPALLPLNKDHG